MSNPKLPTPADLKYRSPEGIKTIIRLDEAMKMPIYLGKDSFDSRSGYEIRIEGYGCNEIERAFCIDKLEESGWEVRATYTDSPTMEIDLEVPRTRFIIYEKEDLS